MPRKGGGLFLRGTDCPVGEAARIEETPSTLVPKRNPDRSWIEGKRAISDLRRINIYFGNGEVRPVELPKIRDLAKRIVALKRKSLQADLLLTKRGIESAFRLIRTHPHLDKVTVTEFPRRHFLG